MKVNFGRIFNPPHYRATLDFTSSKVNLRNSFVLKFTTIIIVSFKSSKNPQAQNHSEFYSYFVLNLHQQSFLKNALK